MNGYIANFAIYSFAMVGFFITILFVYKKSVNQGKLFNKQEFLKVENSLKLSPVKTVYVLKAGSERFLIAGDSANTTMLAKLDNDNIDESVQNDEKVKEFSIIRGLKKISRG